MTYFTSDRHFWHFTIIRLSHRPVASADEMDEAMGEAAGVDGCVDAPGTRPVRRPLARIDGSVVEYLQTWCAFIMNARESNAKGGLGHEVKHDVALIRYACTCRNAGQCCGLRALAGRGMAGVCYFDLDKTFESEIMPMLSRLRRKGR